MVIESESGRLSFYSMTKAERGHVRFLIRHAGRYARKTTPSPPECCALPSRQVLRSVLIDEMMRVNGSNVAHLAADGTPSLFRLRKIIILRSGSPRGRQIVSSLLHGDCQGLHIQLRHGYRED